MEVARCDARAVRHASCTHALWPPWPPHLRFDHAPCTPPQFPETEGDALSCAVCDPPVDVYPAAGLKAGARLAELFKTQARGPLCVGAGATGGRSFAVCLRALLPAAAVVH